jgi:hypothetical protein
MDSAEMKRVRERFSSSARRVAAVAPPVEEPAAPLAAAPRAPEPGAEPAASSRDDSGARKRFRDTIRRDDPDAPAAPTSEQPSRPPERRASPAWGTEAPTSTRRKRSHRPAVVVDDVGDAAVKLARTLCDGAPKPLGSRDMIARAPIDTRAAFVLSLVDGRNAVEALVDMSGMPDEEVRAILARLARLGLISLP